MVDLTEEKAFWEFIAQHNTYVQHKPNGDKLKLEYRFAQFNDEGTIGELTRLGSPRLEMRDSPSGAFLDNGGGFQYDTMMRTIRIISKCKLNDFADVADKQQKGKEACAEIHRYIIQQQESGNLCANKLIKMLDTKSISYQLIEQATSDSSFAGCELRVQFRAKLKTTPVNYGTFIYPGES